MPDLSVLRGDVRVEGDFSARTMGLADASVRNATIASNAGIVATKLEHQHTLTYYIEPATTITAKTIPLWIVRGLTAEIVAIQASIIGTIATGADRTVTVDLKYGNTATAYTTALTATVGFTNASVLRTVSSGTVSVADLAQGDSLQLVVTVAGAAGNQALGLIVAVTVREDAT